MNLQGKKRSVGFVFSLNLIFKILVLCGTCPLGIVFLWMKQCSFSLEWLIWLPIHAGVQGQVLIFLSVTLAVCLICSFFFTQNGHVWFLIIWSPQLYPICILWTYVFLTRLFYLAYIFPGSQWYFWIPLIIFSKHVIILFHDQLSFALDYVFLCQFCFMVLFCGLAHFYNFKRPVGFSSFFSAQSCCVFK